MCGRVNITDNEGVRLLMELVGMSSWPSIQERYNVAPSAILDGLVWNDGLEHATLQWGLIPAWAKPGQFSSPLINARSETVWEKPSFRNLIKNQRVCVPVTGFYEWHRSKGAKQPHYIRPANDESMFLAGIYQRTKTGDSQSRNDLSLLTVEANESMAAVHHRMPVIIPPDAVSAWLSTDEPTDRELLDSLMQPAANDYLSFQKVSDYVNNARNEGPECVASAELF